MRIKIGSTRLDMEQVDAYRVEKNAQEPLVRVYLSGGEYICLNPRFEGMSVDDIVEKLDDVFFEGEQ